MPDERRIDAGPLMAALGGLLLLVSLFLDWFRPDEATEGISAWDAFEVLDLVLAAAALAALLVLAGLFLRDFPLRPRVLLPLGVLAFVIVLSQLIDPPPAAGEDTETEAGVWLALAGSALMLAGAILSAARVSLAVAPRADDAAAPIPGTGASSGGAGPRPSVPVAAGGDAEPAPDPREVEESARVEARENEPVVQAELYPEEARTEPLGSGDPEPWQAPPDEETQPLPESDELPPPDRGPGA